MCLDWLGRYGESGKFFDRAAARDPNGYFMAANIGWHYAQIGDYAAARAWLQRSLSLQWQNNDIARSYLELVQNRMLETATGKNPLPAGF